MPRKSSAEPQPRERRRWFHYSVRVLVVGGVIAGSLYAFQQAEQFLLRDPRFTVTPPDYGLESPSLHVDGIRYASRAQVLRAFAPDFGRSLYEVPLGERREQLRRLDWVRDASIARIWPNRLLVRIEEREPIAFLQLPNQGPLSEFALIDRDGVILAPPKHGSFKLPVVVGIRPDSPAAKRRDSVRRLLRLMSDIGPLGDRVSEVDVTDPDNLKVTSRVDNRAMALMLGDHNFAQRLQNFVNHYAQIQQRLPGATTLDLRLEDRITVVEGKSE